MRSSTLLAATKVGLAIFWGSVILYVLLGSIPESPYPPTQEERVNLLTVSPQAWAFFTRDPRSPVRHLYTRRDGEWEQVDRANFTSRNWMGMKRTSIVEQVELKALLSSVKEQQWTKCTEDVSSCLSNRSVEPVSRLNKSVTDHLCGEYLVREREPVPWAWSHAASDVTMESRVLRLSVSCS